ncbi:MAG: flagellar biosynthesis protein FliQ [Candidatus Carbobacillus altaicus]|uniref:Flagellar biosynthetic protein FliQ n=1 Tax=Candidatus Carbonibacillus altaicus TaxID=2163959 RepID=A0A2R6Y4X7_9BACL|nr:flagellar biosynthesis protein FliQ [Candidatus Carbobacillus altaicus]PTQ57712.1 MAG: Flagellar biosynthesis protein FliQ [Candidatus Carbobacillus altaicus]
MQIETALYIGQQAIYTVLWVIAFPLLIGLITGLVVSIFQATTQIQEQTLAFIPKIVAIMAAIALLGRFMLSRLIEFTLLMFDFARTVSGS